MKKSYGLLTVLISFMTFTSAQGALSSGLSGGMRNLVYTLEETLRPLFSAILGGDDGFLFERVLFFLVVMSVVYVVINTQIKMLNQNKVLTWIITLSVALLSTRYLVEVDVIQSMLVPYSVFGIAISSLFPLIIFFLFVHKGFVDSSTMRKLCWIGFITVFVGIWAARQKDVGDFAWIYLFTALAALIFLLSDGTIRRAIIKQQRTEWKVDSKEAHLSKMRAELDEIIARKTSYSSDSAWKRAVRNQERAIEFVSKE